MRSNHPAMAVLSWVIPILIALGLQGCASPAMVQGMVAPTNTSKTQPFAVEVKTQGGSETGAMDPSMISNADFAKAIEESIVKETLIYSLVQPQTPS